MERYSTLEKIGKGTYGVVHKAKDIKTGEHVALKAIILEDDEGIPSTAVREIALLKHLKHPNVVALNDVIHMQDKLTMVFELLELDLKKYVDVCNGGLETSTVKSLMYQLLQGIQHCHKQSIIHRDLKPANILLNRAGVLKIADFGLSRTISLNNTALKHEVITLWYRSPELLLGKTCYATEVDMWSVGCIFAEMVTGVPTFPGADEMDQIFQIFMKMGRPTSIHNQPSFETSLPLWNEFASYAFQNHPTTTIPSLPDFSSLTHKFVPEGVQFVPKHYTSKHAVIYPDNPALDLLVKLLSVDPNERLTADEAMAHPYFFDLKRKRGTNK